jgi:hypothetical protein
MRHKADACRSHGERPKLLLPVAFCATLQSCSLRSGADGESRMAREDRKRRSHRNLG